MKSVVADYWYVNVLPILFIAASLWLFLALCTQVYPDSVSFIIFVGEYMRKTVSCIMAYHIISFHMYSLCIVLQFITSRHVL